MCQQCSENSINVRGVCDHCGFNEAQHIADYEAWLDDLEPPTVTDWLEYEADEQAKG